jgi:hypothetical protein
MLNYIDKHIIAFVNEWGNKVLPQLAETIYKDASDVFKKTKKCKMILNSLADGKRIYIVGFKNCRGMIQKWLHDENGRMIRDQGRGVIEINPSVITMSTVDINVPFVASDEVLLTKNPKDKPYNLEKEIVEEAMRRFGFNPKTDIIFMFFVSPQDISPTIRRFLDEFRHIITGEYLRAKGILAIKDPKWIKYHASDEVTKYTNTFFFNGVSLTYSNREVEKEKLGK